MRYLALLRLLVVLALIYAQPAAANDSRPRIAFYPFYSHDGFLSEDSRAVQFSYLALLELSKDDSYVLLDRSSVLGAYDRQAVAGITQMLEETLVKQAPCDYLVTGNLVTSDSRQHMSIQFIDNKSSQIIASEIIEYDTTRAQEQAARVAEFVHRQVSRIDDSKLANMVKLAVLRFHPVDPGKPDLGPGILLQDNLINYYEKKTRILARSQMFPVYVESYIEQLQYKAEQLQAKPLSDYLVFGSYRITPQTDAENIELYLTLRKHEGKYDVRETIKYLTGSSWEEVLQQAQAWLSPYLTPRRIAVTDKNHKIAEWHYQKAVKINKYKLSTMGRYDDGVAWKHIFFRASDDRERDRKKTIELLSKAVKLDPYHDRARMFLLDTLRWQTPELSLLARKHLMKIAYQSEDSIAREMAGRSLANGKYGPGSFKKLVEDPQALTDWLQVNSILNEKGHLSYGLESNVEVQDFQIPDYSNRQLGEIYNMFMQSRGHPRHPIAKTIEKKSSIPEAKLYHHFGSSMLEIKLRRKHSHYTLDNFELENSEKFAEQGLTQAHKYWISEGINYLAMTALIDPFSYTAKLRLAHALEVYPNPYALYTNVLYDNIRASSNNEELQFLAANASDKLLETEFSANFEAYIGSYLKQARSNQAGSDKKEKLLETSQAVTEVTQAQVVSDEDYRYTTVDDLSQAHRRIYLEPVVSNDEGFAHSIRAASLDSVNGQYFIGMGGLGGSGRVAIYETTDSDLQKSSTLAGDKPHSSDRHDWFGRSLDGSDGYLIVGAPRDNSKTPISEQTLRDGNLTHRYPASEVLALLFDRGYINVAGMPTEKYRNKQQALDNDFPEFEKKEIHRILQLLGQQTSIRDSGTAYIFRNTEQGWQRDAQLFAGDARESNLFGHRVAIETDTALVCAKSGAYLYRRQEATWRQITTLSKQCRDVEISGDFAFIAQSRKAPLKMVWRTSDRWQSVSSIDVKTNEDAYPADRPGLLAVDDWLVFSTPGDRASEDDPGRHVGVVHVFKRVADRWTKIQRIAVSGAEFSYAGFGSSLAISGRYLAIGAAFKTDHRNEKMKVGEVYLYVNKAGKWELDTILSPAKPADQGNFGGALTIEANTLMIAETNDNGKSRLFLHNLEP